jgi:hypothetical protein
MNRRAVFPPVIRPHAALEFKSTEQDAIILIFRPRKIVKKHSLFGNKTCLQPKTL